MGAPREVDLLPKFPYAYVDVLLHNFQVSHLLFYSCNCATILPEPSFLSVLHEHIYRPVACSMPIFGSFCLLIHLQGAIDQSLLIVHED